MSVATSVTAFVAMPEAVSAAIPYPWRSPSARASIKRYRECAHCTTEITLLRKRKNGNVTAFRVPDCEFPGFSGGGEGACWSISLAECNERCACHAERKPPHAAPRSPFGKLAIRSIFATKASRTRKRAYDIAGKTSGKNTCGRDASLPHATHHISFAAETRSQPSSTHGRSSQAVTELKSLPLQE